MLIIAFTYTGDPSDSVKDEIRFYIGDVDMSDPLLSDEEITFYDQKLDLVYGSTLATASYLADLIANRFGREISLSADGISVQADQLQTKFRDIAKSLREQWHAIAGVAGLPDAGGILWGEEMDPSIKPLVWGKGMDDNMRGGQQEYGGEYPGVVYRESYGLWGY